MIDIKVNDKCNGCGGCLDSVYFEEMDNGCAQIIPGTIIPDSALDELKTIRDECPCQAIDINSKRKSSREIADELLSYIDEVKEVIHISDVDEIAMDPKRHWIKFDVHLSGYEDGFRSYDGAYNALRSEIHRIWDDRKDYALNEAQKYVNEDLRKYWDIKYEEGIFAETQEKLKNAVYAISNSLLVSNLIERPLSEEDYSVRFTEWITRQLLEPECLSKKWAQEVYDLMDYNAMLCALHKSEIKPYETYETGLFGKMKDVTRWGYSGTYNSEEYIQEDIKNRLARVSKYEAKTEINGIIDEYNKQLSEIKSRLVQLVKDNSNRLEVKKN